MTETRRHALKILGTIGATCCFPFASDELYGQHVHTLFVQTPSSEPFKPSFFTPAEYETLSRLTDVIIPATDTAGAIGAGVPEYIDRVVAANSQHQELIRAGLGWLEAQAKSRFSQSVLSASEAQLVEILQPLSDAIDRQQREAWRSRFRTNDQGATVYYFAVTDKSPAAQSPSSVAPQSGSDLPGRFFRLVKNLTADGYYTSRVGLLQELGYTGNTVLAKFPACEIAEH